MSFNLAARQSIGNNTVRIPGKVHSTGTLFLSILFFVSILWFPSLVPTLFHLASVKSPLHKAFLSTAMFPEPSLTPHIPQGPYPRSRYFEGRSCVF